MQIYFEIKTQFSNLGDALINSCLIKLLSKQGELNVCIDGVPSIFAKKLNIPNNVTIFKSKKEFYLNMFSEKGKKVMFMNPGGEVGELSLSQFLKKLLGLSRYIAVKLAGVSLIRIGVSYNNLGKLHILYLKILSKLITQHLVRDKISFNELKNNGISINGVIPDLAFFLKYDKTDYNPTEHVLVSLRKYENISCTDVYNYLLNFIQKDTWDWSFQVESDKRYIENLINESNEKETKINDLTSSIIDAKKFYSNYKFVVTNRLHVLLLAASVGCKVIALLEKDKNLKIEGILKDIELNSLVYFIDDKQQKLLCEYNDYDLLSDSFIKMNETLVNSINNIISKVK